MMEFEEDGRVIVLPDGTKVRHRMKEDEARTVADIYRRVIIDEFWDVPIDRLSRAGAYAAALVGKEDAIGVIILDNDYYPFGCRVFSRGEGANVKAISDEIVETIIGDKADKVIFCISQDVDYVLFPQFEGIITELQANGIITVDLIEVMAHYSYRSVFMSRGMCRYPKK